MKEINYLLGYKNMKIVQDNDMLKFSLDSVLLAHFVTLNPNTKNILDIGTGNAPIPLILSKLTSANICGIEIQKEVADLAVESVKINNLEHQIRIINDDIMDYAKNASEKYDIITCNPPFFKLSEGSNVNVSDYKKIARHEISLDIQKLCKASRSLLKTNGRLAIVHRPERLLEILFCFKENNIEPKKLRFVYPSKGTEANMLLIEGTLNGNPGLKIMDALYVYEKNKYTDELNAMFEKE